MPTAPALRSAWLTARGPISLERPVIAGVLNITPDSFWEGGRVASIDAALKHAAQLIDDGADLVDVGGESTRPGASPVPAGTEAERVVPLIRELVNAWPATPVSVDTVKADVARAALNAGAAIVNDVSALRIDPELARHAADAGAGLILMHSRGTVERMASYDLADYGADPVGTVVDELDASLARALASGIQDDAIVLDPGLGFSKRTEHSIAMIAQLDRLLALGRPVMVGPSRKRFIGELTHGAPPGERLEGTLAACVVALLRGARLFRVHDVRAARRALDVADAIRNAP
jgi:dihydropteroate synthase